MRRITAIVLACAANATLAQQPDYRGDIPMEVYLDALAQISPAARDGAQSYLQAFHRRCGRTLTTHELRRAVADGDGDPVLMGMIRASFQKDNTALRNLEASISCSQRG